MIRKNIYQLMALSIFALVSCVKEEDIFVVEDTEHVVLEIKEQRDGYVYELSSGTIEIEGNLVALKRVDAIEVLLPSSEAGTYVITEEFLVVPDGISLAGNTRLTVTVTKQ